MKNSATHMAQRSRRGRPLSAIRHFHRRSHIARIFNQISSAASVSQAARSRKQKCCAPANPQSIFTRFQRVLGELAAAKVPADRRFLAVGSSLSVMIPPNWVVTVTHFQAWIRPRLIPALQAEGRSFTKTFSPLSRVPGKVPPRAFCCFRCFCRKFTATLEPTPAEILDFWTLRR